MTSLRILEIFNRYQEVGGEEIAAERIAETLGRSYAIERCLFSSAEWTGPGAPAKWRQPFLMFRNPAALAKIKAAHERFRPTVWLVHNVFPVASAAVFELAGTLGVPVIVVCHNFRPFSVNGYCWAGNRLAPEGLRQNFLPEILAGSWQNSRLKTAIFALVLRQLHARQWLDSVKAWIAISDFVRDRFVEAGIPEKKIHTVRHSWVLINRESPAYADQGYFVYIGRLSVEKGLRILFQTWSQLAATMGKDCPILKICGQGPLRREAEEFAASCPKVEYAGSVHDDQKHRMIAGCSAMVVPSLWWEALGLVAYEAYDYGKPVLAAASGGLMEIVQHGKTGLVHQPGDFGGLAGQILELHGNPALGRELGSNGRVWLQESTGRDAWLSKFDSIARELISPAKIS